MVRRLSCGLTLGLWLGSTAFLSPLPGFAQSPAPAATPPSANPPAMPPKAVTDDKAAARAAAESKALASRKAFFDARMAGLRAGLQLTPAQDPLWMPVDAAIRDLAKLRSQRRQAEDSEAADPLHRLMQRSEQLIERGKALKTLTDATAPLVASLDQDQKDRLPTLLGHMGPGGVLRKAFNLPEPRNGWGEDLRRSEMPRYRGDREDHAMGERDRHPGDRDGGGRDDFHGHRGRHDWERGGDPDFESRDGDQYGGRDRHPDQDQDAYNRRYDDHRGDDHRRFDHDRGPEEDPHHHGDHDERT